MIIHHAVGNMLDNRSGLLIVYKTASFDNELFWIVLELVKRSFLDSRKNLNNCLTG